MSLGKSWRSRRRILSLERFEDRLTPAGFVVNLDGNLQDFDLADGVADVDRNAPGLQTTLRAAIQQANHDPATADTITFAAGLTRLTILAVDVGPNVTIDGGAAKVELQFVTSGAHVTLTSAADRPSVLKNVAILNETSFDSAKGILAVGTGGTIENTFVGVSRDGRSQVGSFNTGIDLRDTADWRVANNAVANRATRGIGINASSTVDAVLVGNFVGTAPGLTGPLGKWDIGVEYGADGGRLGGPAAADANVIVGATVGLVVRGATPTEVVGNLIGLLPDGTAAGNTVGVEWSTVGGGARLHANTISGNTDVGLLVTVVTDEADPNNTPQRFTANRIGVNPAATGTRPNGVGVKVAIQTSRFTFGVKPGESADLGNVVAGNTDHGILVANRSGLVVITGNRIGTNFADSDLLGNGGHGVFVARDGDAVVGGPGVEQNVLAHNGLAGVATELHSTFQAGGNTLASGTADIRGNTFRANGGLPIDVLDAAGRPGPTANDLGTTFLRHDADAAQNVPTVEQVILQPATSTTRVVGSLESPVTIAGDRMLIRVYRSRPGGPLEFVGETFAIQRHPDLGPFDFELVAPGADATFRYVATATQVPGNGLSPLITGIVPRPPLNNTRLEGTLTAPGLVAGGVAELQFFRVRRAAAGTRPPRTEFLGATTAVLANPLTGRFDFTFVTPGIDNTARYLVTATQPAGENVAASGRRTGTSEFPFIPPPQPVNLHVKKANETDALFQGLNVVQPVADDEQTVRGVSIDGRKILYTVRVENDGAVPQKFVLKEEPVDPAVTSRVKAEYFVGTRRVTAEMRGTGFETAEPVAPGAPLLLRVEVESANATLPNFEFEYETRVSVFQAADAPPADQVRLLSRFGLVVTTEQDGIDINFLGTDGVLDIDPTKSGDQVSLRAAIEAANAGVGDGQIVFDIPTESGATPVLQILESEGGSLTPLNRPSAAVLGHTQPGAREVVLDGTLAGRLADDGVSGLDADGLTLDAGGIRVEGLIVRGFSGNGVVVNKPGNFIGRLRTEGGAGNVLSGNRQAGLRLNAGGNEVRNNLIGTAENGQDPLPNRVGVMDLAGGNVIGTAGAENVISGNTIGVFVKARRSTTIAHNLIGPDVLKRDAVPNTIGVQVHGGRGVVIANNVIAGNTEVGIDVAELVAGDPAEAFVVEDTQIVENVIGLEVGSNEAFGEQPVGVRAGGTRTRVGGNRIGRHSSAGVELAGQFAVVADNRIILNTIGVEVKGASFALVVGNFIGTDAAGADLGNSGPGVLFRTGTSVVIGSAATSPAFPLVLPAGRANVIAFNGQGVTADSRNAGNAGRMPAVVSNRIFKNDLIGINTTGAVDAPAAPVLQVVEEGAKSIVVKGFVTTPNNGRPNDVLVQFFAHGPDAAPAGPQANRLLGSKLLRNVGPNTLQAFVAPLAGGLQAGQLVTATATVFNLPLLQAETSALSAPAEPVPGVASDTDGVLDAAEGQLDNNGDGVLDKDQANVVAFALDPDPAAAAAITLVTAADLQFRNAAFVPPADAAVGLPDRVRAASGVVSFEVTPDAAGRARVETKLPKGSANRYLKLDPDPDSPTGFSPRLDPDTGAFVFFDQAAVDANGLTVVPLGDLDPNDLLRLDFSDNGRGDDDPAAGVVRDPGMFVLVPEADVALSLAGPPKVALGDQLTFTFTVKNNGSELADNILVRVQLPAEYDFIGGGVLDPQTRTVLIAFGDLIGGASTQRLMTVKPNKVGPANLTAAVNIGGVVLDPNAANDAVGNITPVGPTPPTMRARLVNRKLFVTGTPGADRVRLTLAANRVTVTPLNGQRVNGRAEAQLFIGVGSLDVKTFAGNDVIELVGAGFRGPIVLNGGSGNDRYRLGGRGARVTIVDPDGSDRVGFSLSAVPVTLDLRQVAAQVIDATGTTLALDGRIEAATGSRFDDTIHGQRGVHGLESGGGSDRLLLHSLPPAISRRTTALDALFARPGFPGLFGRPVFAGLLAELAERLGR